MNKLFMIACSVGLASGTVYAQDWNTYGGSPTDPIYRDGRVGIGMLDTSNVLTLLHVQSTVYPGSVLFEGTLGKTPITGAGTRLMWIPEKKAFRAGQVTLGSPLGGSEWDAGNIGHASFSGNTDNMASGENSTAFGYRSVAGGYNSTAFGYKSEANGENSFAAGASASASSDGSVAIGTNSIASENHAFALSGGRASNHGAIAIGVESHASGEHSVAIGSGSSAPGDLSMALANGYSNGLYAMAIGNGCKSTAQQAVSLGSNNQASGPYSMILGSGNDATSPYAMVIGENSQATAAHAMVIGVGGITSGISVKLDNNIPNSIMIGMDTDVPSIFVAPGGGGGSGVPGNVGIGTSNTTWNFNMTVDNLGDNYKNSIHVKTTHNTNWGYGIMHSVTMPKTKAYAVKDNDPTVGDDWVIFGDGSAKTKGIWVTSDKRIKKNIADLESPLEVISKLHGAEYNLISSGEKRYGFIAQEVAEVLPELVRTSDEGLLSVNYTEVIPFLVEAVKVQKETIDQNEEKMTEITEELEKMSAIIADLQAQLNGDSATDENDVNNGNEQLDQVKLYQNTPNPFHERTAIQYYIPEGASNATVLIFNMKGNQVANYPVSDFGYTSSIEVQGSSLSPGTYSYSLFVDGSLSETKKMVVTE